METKSFDVHAKGLEASLKLLQGYWLHWTRLLVPTKGLVWAPIASVGAIGMSSQGSRSDAVEDRPSSPRPVRNLMFEECVIENHD